MKRPLQAAFQSPSVRRLDDWGERAAAPLRANRFADRALHLLSESANHSMLWHSINAIDALGGGPERRRAALRRSVILAIEQGLINGPVKMLIRRERPAPLEERRHELRTPATSSFPSGHASAAACAATLLSRDKGFWPLWWGAALAVSWSRVHVGVHHPSDVLAGLVAGTTLARSAERTWPSSVGPSGVAET
ncbi:MAG TPA: phosphatase PAP2 family protein [Microthrixaceae bacterium]|nr:phosphatase PAP2 family protein [Microthrixaceae bacterium]